ncbi:MAG: 2Fe-2S iron-sulfur cluster-binding protein [Scytonema sp. PMC 1069.18]|nr:2Fe-2S iron-sulfur cluster-binding protein [Scytonema sp. PMC 1069.18]MEC4881454.1 2Fe-2S iron-sulfur cluster-binding protein [Scytonema sp. PMC 1070.18]
MLESLGKIKNPWVRGLTAAATAFSAVTFTTAVLIGITNAKDKSTHHQFGVYSSLLGAGGGAVFGLLYTSKTSQKKEISTQPTGNKTWQDWRNFVVVRKVKESEEITSFYLKPEDGEEIPKFQPGQFLTIKLDIPGQDKPVIRTYSLSDYTTSCEYYRLSIKRELAPKGSDVPPGLASNFMHDFIHEGSVIPAKPPSGRFFLDVHKSIPAVLISNGVGITPMMSMAKACTYHNPTRPVWFIHGARDGRYHAFRDEILVVAQQNSNLKVHFRYSRPRLEDQGFLHSVGYVDIALIQEWVEKQAEFFLCGSPPFMESLREGLKEWGVPESRVFYEAFSKGVKAVSATQPSAIQGEDVTQAEVVFAKSGKTLTWLEGDGSILEFAEANGINPPYSCRIGVCGTCTCNIVSGEVAYQEPPTAATDEGTVLICISKPGASRVVLDL